MNGVNTGVIFTRGRLELLRIIPYDGCCAFQKQTASYSCIVSNVEALDLWMAADEMCPLSLSLSSRPIFHLSLDSFCLLLDYFISALLLAQTRFDRSAVGSWSCSSLSRAFGSDYGAFSHFDGWGGDGCFTGNLTVSFREHWAEQTRRRKWETQISCVCLLQT